MVTFFENSYRRKNLLLNLKNKGIVYVTLAMYFLFISLNQKYLWQD